ncbi:glycosyltransferase [Rhodopila sp.]|uniref:glycosyltransferase n=1 Tax=Rhodopila sp. TaxID=2480087 RepID=UPI003D0E4023
MLAGVAAVLAGIGLAEALVGSRLVTSFARQSGGADPIVRPPVTLLKPLHGDEPLLAEALATLCRQDYPSWQIVFGVQDATDSAIGVVRRLQARFPSLDIDLVIDPTLHGRNRKVGNLINMISAARHDVLVIADADVHVRSDYLNRLVAALERPGVGLVTTLYAGLPAAVARGSASGSGVRPAPCPDAARRPRTDDTAVAGGRAIGLAARLGAMQITHGFLPSALVARALGRQDCLGATMCLRRRDLESIGGLHALVEHLADDNVLGRRINGLGSSVVLADTVALTTVPESSFGALFRHELRWARTIRALEPAGFAASVIQYPLVWALLTVLLSGGAAWSVGCFLLAWMLRAVAALSVDRALAPLWRTRQAWSSGQAWSGQASSGQAWSGGNDQAAVAFCCPIWLLPLRDVFSVAVMAASYGGRKVHWRGHGLHADTPPPPAHQSVTLRL